MQPSLRTIKHGLRTATERLARELAQPSEAPPRWDRLQWQLAAAAAAAHGVSPLLQRQSLWQTAEWTRFLDEQRAHVAHRHRRIALLLTQIDAAARSAGIAVTGLKGTALHRLGVYLPGDRPMADIDLLVEPEDAPRAAELLCARGYVASFDQWKHQVFKPVHGEAVAGLGEHRDAPISIELHTRIQERLPVACVDITARVLPERPQPGLNAYPSIGALMCHLLLHAAGGICHRSIRLMHLHDLALLVTRMGPRDWEVLWEDSAAPPWWALPPLLLLQRYHGDVVPAAVLARLRAQCAPLLRMRAARLTLTSASCSNLWLPALPGIEWSRSLGEARQYLRQRIAPSAESRKERADMLRTQLWLQDQPWVRQSQTRRLMTRLTRPVPRTDMLYVVRAALDGYLQPA
ncbi:nucleotidyltransferase family protein [Xanthomonas campestris]|uniref:nucleotidyltransferase family protein n=1 Tax=Xanthomonas campestris TaxID=339 RepID=UPI002B221C5B|nr:nucleotidyltransferase family protein [Xanthomonas campestris]MEA9756656.1 nucleotidyltransferase family protein [Xanthomonas campestris pv. raphani]MEA9764438.1 nucleotidyltransferase family protein [Xanthomonas campestris pv. raphani]MEA9817003.1 nucleotidyltransferase family protein [Xanthomonas campestris pv. raphani]MEA9910190.1 nucleotidyltransferase family protein [Xanthomonas campestris pv. raphani]MEA9926358.1 nucleotidyltransferase family protein [Xanthomonas campestris pv. raphan